ncbi:hypothetical protein [Vibrio panuliri]|uniref:Uncharacterized protein n=1 Tax=Vibrio panuliri TaxID=1381081 RepID=A0ABX3FJL0_9VIBR|nr:hypothetical protein [Vibrio panuliri]KAB1460849.1 hypothetical protein F7O85_00295 [Vibrio panuliri]OLQ91654.1 hypothetical protein BIY20_09635 [Vibrio panuliri]
MQKRYSGKPHIKRHFGCWSVWINRRLIVICAKLEVAIKSACLMHSKMFHFLAGLRDYAVKALHKGYKATSTNVLKAIVWIDDACTMSEHKGYRPNALDSMALRHTFHYCHNK